MNNQNQLVIMPEIIKKSSVIGRSPKGVAVLAFETEAMMRAWIKLREDNGSPKQNIKFYRQTITEELIPL